eukprot:TRINITY_DN275_c0_g1_i1.p1 TRINITY_DN275_c0_g1~~TRINITY_DN275_c0_g1_i1.p1  ORF type:complete len:236 (-),score=43.55 TRINITY_DN275_c0_g1_i1:269-976(-)
MMRTMRSTDPESLRLSGSVDPLPEPPHTQTNSEINGLWPKALFVWMMQSVYLLLSVVARTIRGDAVETQQEQGTDQHAEAPTPLEPPPQNQYASMCQGMWAALEENQEESDLEKSVTIESPASWKRRRDSELARCGAAQGESSFLEIRSSGTVLTAPGAASTTTRLEFVTEKQEKQEEPMVAGLVEVTLDSPVAVPQSPRVVLEEPALVDQAQSKMQKAKYAIARKIDDLRAFLT